MDKQKRIDWDRASLAAECVRWRLKGAAQSLFLLVDLNEKEIEGCRLSGWITDYRLEEIDGESCVVIDTTLRTLARLLGCSHTAVIKALNRLEALSLASSGTGSEGTRIVLRPGRLFKLPRRGGDPPGGGNQVETKWKPSGNQVETKWKPLGFPPSVIKTDTDTDTDSDLLETSSESVSESEGVETPGVSTWLPPAAVDGDSIFDQISESTLKSIRNDSAAKRLRTWYDWQKSHPRAVLSGETLDEASGEERDWIVCLAAALAAISRARSPVGYWIKILAQRRDVSPCWLQAARQHLVHHDHQAESELQIQKYQQTAAHRRDLRGEQDRLEAGYGELLDAMDDSEKLALYIRMTGQPPKNRKLVLHAANRLLFLKRLHEESTPAVVNSRGAESGMIKEFRDGGAAS